MVTVLMGMELTHLGFSPKNMLMLTDTYGQELLLRITRVRIHMAHSHCCKGVISVHEAALCDAHCVKKYF